MPRIRLAVTVLVAGAALVAAPLSAAQARALPALPPAAAGPVNYDFAAGALAGFLFPQTPPPGADNFGCKPSSAHPDPVVLVNGTFGNQDDNWQAASPLLANHGYCVFTFNYGGSSASAVVQGTGDIAASAGQLASFVTRVLAATGPAQVDQVGHSQGGMMPRYYLKFLGGAPKVHTLVGIAPTNHGGTASGIFTVAQQIPGATQVIGTACPACVEQFVGSDFNQRLDAGGDTVPGVRYTTIVTRNDELVTPYTNQFLTGPDVHNVVVQDLCPLDVSDHVLVGTVDGIAFHEAANALDPENATPTTCADLLTGVTGALI
jgi:triacylglycerol esterase/lipase EstA (alpha/beta hydrolase family)